MDFLNERNIRLINGSPYSPHSQGTVERIHREILKGLLYILINILKNFNLKKSLKVVMNNYNNNIHCVTNYTPNEIFYRQMKIY